MRILELLSSEKDVPTRIDPPPISTFYACLPLLGRQCLSRTYPLALPWGSKEERENFASGGQSTTEWYE